MALNMNMNTRQTVSALKMTRVAHARENEKREEETKRCSGAVRVKWDHESNAAVSQ